MPMTLKTSAVPIINYNTWPNPVRQCNLSPLRVVDKEFLAPPIILCPYLHQVHNLSNPPRIRRYFLILGGRKIKLEYNIEIT